MNISRINDGLKGVPNVMIHQLNGPQLLAHAFPLALMPVLYDQYERAGEYCQQEFVDERNLGVQSASRHPKPNQVIDQGDGCACS